MLLFALEGAGVLDLMVAWRRIVALGSVVLAVTAGGAMAQGPATGQEAQAGTAAALDAEAERESYRACAAAVCPALRGHEPAEGFVACNLQKTVGRETLVNLLAGRPSWPWGDVRCHSLVRLDRAVLARVALEPELDAQLGVHDVRCHIDNGQGGDTFAVRLQPRITFKDGRAVAASLYWEGFLARPSLWTALWSVRAFYDVHGFLQRAAVNDINEFIGTTCTEVKEAWQDK
jgi:hypothetical protein